MSLEQGSTNFISNEDIKQKAISQYNSQMVKDNGIPTETINLPSKGWYYSTNHPLSNGTIEMRYMTAKDEDIITSKNLRKQKTAIERLLQALIVTPGVLIKDILAIDIFALMIAARVLGYGKDYNVEIPDQAEPTYKQKLSIDLTTLEEKPINFLDEYKNTNEFDFILPKTGTLVKWKFLTYSEESDVDKRNEVTVANKNAVESTLSNLLKKQIVEFNGERNPERISKLVDNMFAIESSALRRHIEENKPGIDTKITYTSDITGDQHTIQLPLTAEFFWPTT